MVLQITREKIPLLQLGITCALHKEACQKTNGFQSKNPKKQVNVKVRN